METVKGLAEPSLLRKPTPVRELGVVSGTLGTNLPPARLQDAIPGTISVSCLFRCGLRLGLPACGELAALIQRAARNWTTAAGPAWARLDSGRGRVGERTAVVAFSARDSRRWGMAALQSYSGASGPQSQGEALARQCGSSTAGNLGYGAVSLKYFSVSGDAGGGRAEVVERIQGSSHIHYGFAE